MTKEERNAYMREYRHKNKDKIKNIAHACYIKHQAARLEYRHKYYIEHKGDKNNVRDNNGLDDKT